MFPRARDGDYGGFNDEQGNKSVMATSLFPRDGTKLLAEEALRPYPELLQGVIEACRPNIGSCEYEPASHLSRLDLGSHLKDPYVQEEEEPMQQIGVDTDLQAELVGRHKWNTYSVERVAEGTGLEGDTETITIGPYCQIVENEAHTLLFKRPDGRLEPSESYVGRKALAGNAAENNPAQAITPVSLQLFPGLPPGAAIDEDVLQAWLRISAACPFAANLLDAFILEEGASNGSATLCLVYELQGGAMSMASALQAATAASPAGLLACNRSAEEVLVELWIAQLLWTLRFVHHEMHWFIGAPLLINPQNVLLGSQHSRLRINGLGALQLLTLARSPLRYSPSEIRAQQLNDLRALPEVIKFFLSGSRRSLVRSSVIAPLLNFLEQRVSLSSAPLADLLMLPAAHSLLQRLVQRSFQRQDYLENQMVLQIQSERILGLLCKLIFIVERFKTDDSLKTWPSKTPILLFYQLLFAKKNLPGIPDMDMLHVIGVMKELDLGSDDHILLAQENASSCFVSSFAELAYQIEETFTAILYKE